MISYILAIVIFAGIGAIAVFGYKTSMELADRLESARRRVPAPPAAAADTPVPS